MISFLYQDVFNGQRDFVVNKIKIDFILEILHHCFFVFFIRIFVLIVVLSLTFYVTNHTHLTYFCIYNKCLRLKTHFNMEIHGLVLLEVHWPLKKID